MENPGRGAGASETCQLGGDRAEVTRSPDTTQDFLDAALRHRWPPEVLGAILAHRLDPRRRLLLTAGGLHSLDAEGRDRLLEAAHIDFYSDDALEREAERQRLQWCQWCATRPRRARR